MEAACSRSRRRAGPVPGTRGSPPGGRDRRGPEHGLAEYSHRRHRGGGALHPIPDPSGAVAEQRRLQLSVAGRQGATSSTYPLADDGQGKAIRVRVSFTDDASNDETLTSAATAAVAAKPNSPATGQPTITGTVQVGETLTAVTSDIEDDDGLTNASFSYQWLAGDADISGATGSTYTLADADEGKAVQVRVSFADDAGNEETLTSAATAAVEPTPAPPPPAPTNLTAVVNEDGWVTLTWDAPDDDSVTGYLILRRRPHEGEETLLVHVENTGSAATTYTDTNATSGVRYVYRVKAINAAGLSQWPNYARATP